MDYFRNLKQIRSIMTSEILPRKDPKRRRIMILTADESVIDEIEKGNNEVLLEQLVVQSKVDNCISSDRQVSDTLFSYRKRSCYAYRSRCSHRIRRIKRTEVC
jgi:hypothetical protein